MPSHLSPLYPLPNKKYKKFTLNNEMFFCYRVRNLANTVTKNKFIIGGEAPKNDNPVTCITNAGMFMFHYYEQN